MQPENIEILVLTIPSVTEDVEANQLVGFDGGPCGQDTPIKGVAKFAAEVGEPLAVITLGIVELVAANAIASGDKVYSDENANITSTGTNHPLGYAVTGGGAGDIVAILIK